MTSFQNLTLTRQYPNHSDVITLDRDGHRNNGSARGARDPMSCPCWMSFRANQIMLSRRWCSAASAITKEHALACAEPNGRSSGCKATSAPGRHVSGAQAFLVPGQTLRRLRLDDRIVGTVWSDTDADYCLLAGILPADLAAPRSAQTRSCYEQMETALQQASMDFSHVVRTWLYLDRLLSWYGEFNQGRTGFFKERGVFERLIPASTGIGASNPFGAALACGALAIRPRHSGLRICEVESPCNARRRNTAVPSAARWKWRAPITGC